NYSVGNPWANFYLLKLPGFKYIFMFIISLAIAPFWFQFLFKNIQIKWLSKIAAHFILLLFFVANIAIIYNFQRILASNIALPSTIVQ
ncbi:MAG: hypothetical protein ACREPR_22470, partial [Brasilonema sp.]